MPGKVLVGLGLFFVIRQVGVVVREVGQGLAELVLRAGQVLVGLGKQARILGLGGQADGLIPGGSVVDQVRLKEMAEGFDLLGLRPVLRRIKPIGGLGRILGKRLANSLK